MGLQSIALARIVCIYKEQQHSHAIITSSRVSSSPQHHNTAANRTIYSKPTAIAANAQSMKPAFVSRMFWLNSLLVG